MERFSKVPLGVAGHPYVYRVPVYPHYPQHSVFPLRQCHQILRSVGQCCIVLLGEEKIARLIKKAEKGWIT
jgi:hypothetical protein